MKIKKGDNVVVIAGKDRGKKGKVVRVLAKEERILVEGVQIRKKHLRPKKGGEKGQVIEQPSPLSVSNVKLVCPKCAKASRIGYTLQGGTKERICKKCKAII